MVEDDLLQLLLLRRRIDSAVGFWFGEAFGETVTPIGLARLEKEIKDLQAELELQSKARPQVHLERLMDEIDQMEAALGLLDKKAAELRGICAKITAEQQMTSIIVSFALGGDEPKGGNNQEGKGAEKEMGKKTILEERQKNEFTFSPIKKSLESPSIPTTTLRQRPRGETITRESSSAFPASPTSSRHIRKEHDELSADLVRMARALKLKNLALQELVKEDRTIVHDTDLALGTNASRFREQHKQLKAFTSQSWATTRKLLLMTVLVIISIICLFALIIITGK